MDFFNVKTEKNRKGTVEVYPNFLVGRSKDLMVKGRSFYAIWDEKAGLWSTDEYDVQRIVDTELSNWVDENEGVFYVKYMRNFDSDRWAVFRKFVANISDNSTPLDDKLIFANTDVVKEDYATKRLPYPLEEGDHSAWDEIVGTLYSKEERDKIEWAIGSVISGESRYLQKFLVFYGPSGTGKSTILNIIQSLFEGYSVMFDAKALGSNNNAFSTEVFKSNPLVAIQHDGDLSKIEDNTKLNSIVSHEDMLVNEKYKPGYTARVNAFLFMGTNLPVKISDAKSGLIRRLIDVEPTGETVNSQRYGSLMNKIKFEYGAIAKHCLNRYKEMGSHYYDDYRPMSMMFKTDHILNFVSDHYDIFSGEPYITAKRAYDLYKTFCEETGIEKKFSRQKFQSELSNYFKEFHDRTRLDGVMIRSVFVGFDIDKVKPVVFEPEDKKTPVLEMESSESIFDKEYSDQPAQRAKKDGTPARSWKSVRTTLSGINTSELHYVKVPEKHIVIDFDLKNDEGDKDLDKNLRAAAEWPTTYAELSKSGAGVHLHYIYDGDTDTLANLYDTDIEVKVYRGDASLRRKLTKCNDEKIARISSGLPTKEKKVLSEKTVRSEKGLRDLVARNLRKEIHPGTKPSVEFIKKILDDAYSSDLTYDLTDMRASVTAFGSKSSNHALDMIKLVQQMKFKGDGDAEGSDNPDDNTSLVFYDVEVFPNLLLICWKFEGADQVVRMVNPSPAEVEELFKLKLVGFNNRRYDNHILYGRYMGYNHEALYKLSQGIVNNDRSMMFGEAYELSYADIYDFSSKKQSLKKFEIELGITHMENHIPWDEPVPDDKLDQIIEYCVNDVHATEAVFKARRADFTARQILANLSGKSINTTTQNHTAKILFGNEREPQKDFIYTNLATGERSDGKVDDVKFEGYIFDMGKSSYKDEDPSEGGYVYAEPGMYSNVAVLDVASMHPTSIRELDLFGPYTKNFGDLVDARIAIKRGNYDEARKMLDGKLEPYLKDEGDAKELSYALKIVINIVYGLTSAKFPNKFRDNRNKDNIVAKRGALFMIDLKNYVEEHGFTVAHIKTDSIKIPDATEEIIAKVFEFGKQYGYDFEHENTYDKFCLVNDAVYIAKDGDEWDAVGAQFQHPYVYKMLFTEEDIEFEDYCETKQVSKGAIHIQPEVGERQFIGRIGRFVPVKPETDGSGKLLRVMDDKDFAVTGTKGYIWARDDVAKAHGFDCVDTSYAESLVESAKTKINKFGGGVKELFS